MYCPDRISNGVSYYDPHSGILSSICPKKNKKSKKMLDLVADMEYAYFAMVWTRVENSRCFGL